MNEYKSIFSMKELEQPENIFVGSFMESAVDSATFGIFQPDIVPDLIEQQSPIASTVGHIAGNIVGFFPSFGLASKAVRGLWGGFNFSRKVMAAAESVKATGMIIQTSRPFAPALLTTTHTAATFALHDAAREFVAQTKAQDYNLYELGKRSLLGGMTGGMIGYIGEATQASNPIVQAMSLASTMTIAESIADASDGEDVMSVEYLKKRVPMTFVQGFGLGLINSRGWKERRAFKEEAPLKAWMELVEQNKGKPIMTILEEIGGVKKESLPPELIEAVKLSEKYATKPVETMRGSQGRVHKLKDTLKLTDTQYKELLTEWTGVSSTKEFKSKEQYDVVFTEFDTYVKNMLSKNKFRSMGVMERYLRPVDDLADALGMSDIGGIKNLFMSNRLRMVEGSLGDGLAKGLESQFIREWNKTSGKTTTELAGIAVKNKVFNRVSDAKLELSKYLRGESTMENWSPGVIKVAREYREVTDIYYKRINEARIVMGKEPISYNDFYMRSDIDRVAMKRAGREAEIPLYEYEKQPFRRKLTPEKEQSTEKERTGKDFIYKDDPFVALQNMIRFDLKTIYLHEPHKLAVEELKTLKRNGLIDAKVYEDFSTIINKVIWSQPSELAVRFNDQVKRLLTDNKAGQAIDAIAVKMNRDLGSNPAEYLANSFGNLITSAYIGLRPRIAIRNAFQWMYGHSFTSTQSMAKAMYVMLDKSKEPALSKQIRTESLYRKNAGGMIEEQAMTGNAWDTANYSMQNRGQIGNIDMTMIAGYYQAKSYITDPKLRKHGWADKDGIQGRKTNPEYMSKREQGLVKNLMEEVANNTQFDYTSMGMGLIYRDSIMKPMVKLMSFPMSYYYKFLGNLGYRMMNNKPKWAENENITLTMSDRIGAVKHFVYLGAFVAAMERLGFDYSSMVAGSYTKERGFKSGVFEMRPSPAMNMMFAVKDMFSSNEYIRETARNRLKDMVPIPGMMTYKDIKRSIEKGDPAEMFLYRYRKPKVKVTELNPTPFSGGFETFKPFNSMW